MKKEIKEISAIEGEVTITLEEKDYLEDFRKNVVGFKKRFTRNGFRGSSTPNSIIYAEYGYELLYQTCMKKISEMLHDIRKQDLFSNTAYSDIVLVSSSFPSHKDSIAYANPGTFSFTFQYGLIRKVNIDDSFLDNLKEITIEKERCFDLSKENLEFFTKKIYYSLLNKTVNEDLDEINLADLDVMHVNMTSLFLNNLDGVKRSDLKWLLDDFDVSRLINSGFSSSAEIKLNDFQNAVKAHVLFILNTILGKKFRALLREKCIETFKIEVPLNYLRVKIKSALNNSNDKIVEHYLPLFNNSIKWECLRTAIKDKHNISYIEDERRVYDVVYKYLGNSALFCEYDDILSRNVTPGTYDNFSESSLAIIDLKVINMLENTCKLQIVDIIYDDILNNLLNKSEKK